VENHSAAQNFVAHSCQTYGVDNLLGEILVTATAYTTKLLLALVWEGVAQITHYHLATISQYVGQEQIYKATYDVVSYQVG
jgi:hypothetical protein